MKYIRLSILLCILFFINTVHSQTVNDTSKKRDPFFEISFGKSVLFVPQSKVSKIQNQTSVVLPTSALLFFAELRPKKLIRFPFFFNLPTESRQILINGQLINQKASSTFGSGIIFRALKFKIDEKSKIELEAGTLVSCIIDTKNVFRFAPVIASRIRIMRGDYFIMYIGGSYSIGIDVIGMLFGTGTMF